VVAVVAVVLAHCFVLKAKLQPQRMNRTGPLYEFII
jgi:hypothetical protein